MSWIKNGGLNRNLSDCLGRLKMLDIGTVCVEENYRKQNYAKMFAYLDQNVFPDYDLLYLSGDKTRYEHFGFIKPDKSLLSD